MAAIGDATVDKYIRDAFRNREFPNTKLNRGACAAIRPVLRSHMRRTLAWSRMLAKYVRNGAHNNFTSTDVAVVDYIRDLHDANGLAQRVSGAGYKDFFNRAPRAPRAPTPRGENEAARRERARRGKGKHQATQTSPQRNSGHEGGSQGGSPQGSQGGSQGGSPPASQGGRGGSPRPQRRQRRRSMMNMRVNMDYHYEVPIHPYGDCLFNCLGVANEFVRDRDNFPIFVTDEQQEQLGDLARAAIVRFLRQNGNALVQSPAYRHHTWADMHTNVHPNEQYESDVPVNERSYERYLQWLAIKGNWGDIVCIVAGQEAFGRPVISNVVRRVGNDYIAQIDFSADPSLPMIEQLAANGIHYTAWLPRMRENGAGPSTVYLPSTVTSTVVNLDPPGGNVGNNAPGGNAGNNAPGGNAGNNAPGGNARKQRTRWKCRQRQGTNKAHAVPEADFHRKAVTRTYARGDGRREACTPQASTP